jgi:hypothetical protein
MLDGSEAKAVEVDSEKFGIGKEYVGWFENSCFCERQG